MRFGDGWACSTSTAPGRSILAPWHRFQPPRAGGVAACVRLGRGGGVAAHGGLRRGGERVPAPRDAGGEDRARPPERRGRGQARRGPEQQRTLGRHWEPLLMF